MPIVVLTDKPHFHDDGYLMYRFPEFYIFAGRIVENGSSYHKDKSVVLTRRETDQDFNLLTKAWERIVKQYRILYDACLYNSSGSMSYSLPGKYLKGQEREVLNNAIAELVSG